MTATILFSLAVLVITILCLNAHDRMHRRRADSDGRLSRLGKLMHETEEEKNQ